MATEKDKLADYLKVRDIGRLEIETRGVEVDPQRLRNRLKPRGDKAGTLFATRMAKRVVAIAAERLRHELD